MDDADLAGPFVFCFAFAFVLLLVSWAVPVEVEADDTLLLLLPSVDFNALPLNSSAILLRFIYAVSRSPLPHTHL